MATEANLVLEHLRDIRGDVGALREDMREVKVRLNDLHSVVAGQRWDQAHGAEVVAHLQARMDRLRDEIERIKRRVDLTDT